MSYEQTHGFQSVLKSGSRLPSWIGLSSSLVQPPNGKH